MRLVSFHDWIRQIYATRDDELDCDQVFELMAPYVDAVVRGEDKWAGASERAEVEHHLSQCPQCTDLFLGLRDAARLEREAPATTVVPVERC